ncbi:MAG TPA: polysaccharide biosynthesis tyrosine autokinase [Ilumatobacteraceae bacterium]|nr:polysaccharide biosynthesis tyrosine autokinase [Ilumatobacteraceae bacterium]
MTLRGFRRVVIRRWWIVIVAIIATAAPAIALSLRQDAIYRGDADMLIHTLPGESVFGSGQQNVNADRLVRNEISVLEGDAVYERLKDNLGLDDDPPKVAGSALRDADVITASVESGDPQTAATLANAYVQAYIDVKREQNVAGITAASAELQTKITELQDQIDTLDVKINASSTDDDSTAEAERRSLDDQLSSFRQHIDQLQVDAALSAGNAELIRPASPPTEPIKPTPVRTATLAALVGLLIGLGAVLLIERLDDSIRTEDDLARLRPDVPVLGMVPTVNSAGGRPVSIAAPASPAVECYRNLRTNVQFLSIERKVRSILVTSTRPGEGKTTTAANLAVVLSETGANVVLVDADLRKPDLHRVFAIDGSNGLTNNLHGDPMELTMQHISDHLWVIVGGPVPPNPSELLSGRRMDAFREELARRFDYVIIDSAPLLAVSDGASLSRHVDAVLLVAQSKRVSMSQLEESVAMLDRVRAPLLGIVLTRAKVDSQVVGEYEYARSTANKRRKR